MDRWSRRQFVQGVGVTGLALGAGCGRLPFQGTATVPQPSPMLRIGFLTANTPAATAEQREAFVQGLADHGYLEGRTIAIEWRFAEGSLDRAATLAAELVALEVAVIVVTGARLAQVAQRASSTVPIVVAGVAGDLVSEGLAVSLARPAGQITGLSNPPQLEGKRFQLLTEAVVGISKVAVLWDANGLALPQADYEDWAHRLGVQLQFLEVERPHELDSALAAARRERADGLDVARGPLLSAESSRIVAFAAEHRLPAMYYQRVFVAEWGLMSYEPRRSDLFRRAAYYVDRLLKGAKPADLPVEQPMTFDFVINLKTAQALGLTIPQHVLLQATEVLQ